MRSRETRRSRPGAAAAVGFGRVGTERRWLGPGAPTFRRSTASTTSRGYGTGHQVERRRWKLVVESGYASCVRCGFPIVPGAAFHLDHRDDKLGYLGVSHARCNLRAAAKLGTSGCVRSRRLRGR